MYRNWIMPRTHLENLRSKHTISWNPMDFFHWYSFTADFGKTPDEIWECDQKKAWVLKDTAGDVCCGINRGRLSRSAISPKSFEELCCVVNDARRHKVTLQQLSGQEVLKGSHFAQTLDQDWKQVSRKICNILQGYSYSNLTNYKLIDNKLQIWWDNLFNSLYAVQSGGRASSQTMNLQL